MFRKRGIIYPYIWEFNEIVDGKKAPGLFIIQLGSDLGAALALCKLHLFFHVEQSPSSLPAPFPSHAWESMAAAGNGWL